MSTTPRSPRSPRSDNAGYSLVELLVALGITTVIMGATMTGLSNAVRANETVLGVTGMNDMLRASMDLMVRDLLQVGFGLPAGHVITTPSGTSSVLVRLPGPPSTAYTMKAGDIDMAAVLPGTGKGPVVNGVATDMITVLMADSSFNNVALDAVTSTTVDIDDASPVNIAAGPDRVTPGQLMMVTKGSFSTLVQVTAVNTTLRRLTFASGDSLSLNQPAAGAGTLARLNAEAPANTPSSTKVHRVRMVSYYLDTTNANRPRLVRRINNGKPTEFDNTLGTAFGLGIENLQFSFDLAGYGNPSNVRFTTADLAGGGACGANPCSETQIRKVNVALTGRSRTGTNKNGKVHRN